MHNYVRIYIQTHQFASFTQYFSMTHMPPKPSAGCDTTLFLCNKLTFQIKIYTQNRVYLVPFFQNFLEEIYMPPKPLAN